MSCAPFAPSTAPLPGRAAERRESTARGAVARGNAGCESARSNSRFSLTGVRLLPESQIAAVAQAVRDGRITSAEGERLVGFLFLGDDLVGERTARRRRAKLRDLGIGRSPLEELALELVRLHDRGEITTLELERQAGRALLAFVRDR